MADTQRYTCISCNTIKDNIRYHGTAGLLPMAIMIMLLMLVLMLLLMIMTMVMMLG